MQIERWFCLIQLNDGSNFDSQDFEIVDLFLRISYFYLKKI